MNIAKATIRKLMIVLTNTPMFTVTAPAVFASASDAYGPAAFAPSFSVTKRFEKSTLPSGRPIGG